MQFLDASWKISIEALPYIQLGFLGYAVYAYRGEDLLEAAVESQSLYPLFYGPWLIAGFLAGSIPFLLLGGGAGLAAGGMTAVGACTYRFFRDGTPRESGKGFEGWNALRLLWLSVPLISAASLIHHGVLLKSVVGVIFYSTVFWEV